MENHFFVYTKLLIHMVNYLPFSNLESERPEDLWNWLEKTKDRTGADFLAIPHNSNVSMGQMFMLEHLVF